MKIHNYYYMIKVILVIHHNIFKVIMIFIFYFVINHNNFMDYFFYMDLLITCIFTSNHNNLIYSLHSFLNMDHFLLFMQEVVVIVYIAIIINNLKFLDLSFLVMNLFIVISLYRNHNHFLDIVEIMMVLQVMFMDNCLLSNQFLITKYLHSLILLSVIVMDQTFNHLRQPSILYERDQFTFN